MPGRSGGAVSTSDMPEGYLARGEFNRRSRDSAGQLQRAVGGGQQPAAARLHDHVVLDPDAAPARQVDPRLDRDAHALGEPGRAARLEARVLVDLKTEAVGEP